MPVKKKVKVKDVAKKYDLPASKVLTELAGMGLRLDSPSSEIEPDLTELVDDHFIGLQKKSKKPKEPGAPEADAAEAKEKPGANEVHMKPPVVVRALSDALGKRPNEIVSALLKMNVLAGINQTIEPDVAVKLCKSFGITLILERREKDEHSKHEEKEGLKEPEYRDNPENLVERPPVVTFLGHVDHGKTSLQDYIRKTSIVSTEAGGITQHIGASVVKVGNKSITFIDTPGHEAFTAMRARGANVTDIAILVVAADDGFMPQTIEALNHAKAANVPVIVAINKMDLPTANPEKILRQIQQNGLSSEEWGGQTGTVRVSAVTGAGISELLDRIILESEMLQLKADMKRPATGVVLEARLEQGLGPTANVLIRAGTLNTGDPILCGEHYGRVRTIFDTLGRKIKSAGPSEPVKVVGLVGVPEAGSKLVVCNSEKEARVIAEERVQKKRTSDLEDGVKASGGAATTLEDLFSKLDSNTKKKLCLVVKADVQGSIEAISESLKKIPSDKISISILHSATGAITENDVLLASASGAIVVGFHVQVNPGVNNLAKKEKVEIRLYSIIYELIEDLKDALAGRLAPEQRQVELGTAVILKIFTMSKGPKVCGCMVEKGVIKVGAKARVFRSSEIIYNGSVQSLRRFQDDVREVRQGFECGIRLDNFDFQEGDRIQVYEVEFKKATL